MKIFIFFICMLLANLAFAQNQTCKNITLFYRSGESIDAIACFYPNAPSKPGEESQVVIYTKQDIEISRFKVTVTSTEEGRWRGGNNCKALNYPHLVHQTKELPLTNISRMESGLSCREKTTWD